MNCLVTKIKESIDNKKLVKSNELFLGVLKKNKTIYVTTEKGTAPNYDIYDNNNNLLISLKNKGESYTANQDCYIILTNKNEFEAMAFQYNETQLESGISLEDFKYCSNLKRLDLTSSTVISGNIEELGMLPLVYIFLNNNKIYGTLEGFIKKLRKYNESGRTNIHNIDASNITLQGKVPSGYNTYIGWTKDYAYFENPRVKYIYIYNSEELKESYRNQGYSVYDLILD